MKLCVIIVVQNNKQRHKNMNKIDEQGEAIAETLLDIQVNKNMILKQTTLIADRQKRGQDIPEEASRTIHECRKNIERHKLKAVNQHIEQIALIKEL